MNMNRRFFLGAGLGAVASAIVAVAMPKQVLGIVTGLEPTPKLPSKWTELISGRIGLYCGKHAPSAEDIVVAKAIGNLVDYDELNRLLIPVANTEYEIPISILTKPGYFQFFTPVYRWTFHSPLEKPVQGLYLTNSKGEVIWYSKMAAEAKIQTGDSIMSCIAGYIDQ